MGNHLSRGNIKPHALEDLIDRVLARGSAMQGKDLAVHLGVSESYVTKLRKGSRPTRMNADVVQRMRDFAPEPGRDPVAALLDEKLAVFASGVLWGIERQARDMMTTASTAREQLLRAARTGDLSGISTLTQPVSPTAGEIAIGLEALAAVEASTATGHSKKPRRAQPRPA